MNSGGSPSGDSAPPILPTRKMKNTTTWTLCSRAALARNERPDQDHGGAGGADDAGDQRAERQHGGVDQRRAAQRAGEHDAAGDDIEREQKRDEADIVAENGVGQERQRRVGAAHRRQRRQRQHRPEEGEFAVVVMPQAGKQQRPERDGEQNAGKRQHPRPRQARAVECGGVRPRVGSNVSWRQARAMKRVAITRQFAMTLRSLHYAR